MPQMLDTEFWAGTELALAAYVAGEKLDVSAYRSTNDNDDDEEQVPRLFSQHGNVGVITVAGPLVNNDSWVNAYVGRTGYPEIRAALIYAVSNPDIGAIVLDINSGGGSVSGVPDTAALVSQVDKIKPVHTFSDGQISSAAYWFGVSARSVHIGSVTEAGSIGVLTVHQEISKALSMQGVKATVLKAGEFKAAGNQYEPLSDKAREDTQGKLDYMYSMFTQHVAQERGVSYEMADTKMAQGRVFIGAQAVSVGLVDGVSTFDEVVSKAQGGIDSRKASSQYGANFSKGPAMKVALTTQQVAAMAEGGAIAAVATHETDAALAAAAAAALLATAPAADAPAPAADAPVAAPAADAVPAAPEAPAADASLVAFLKTSLAETSAANTALTIELRDLKAASDAAMATHAALRSIAVASVDRLAVAMGRTGGTADALQDTALLAEHASLRAQFESQFKVGGVAAVATGAQPDNVKGEAFDPVRQARLASTRPA